jgi:predicted  nucleic acid-binding Zn-ribbon protein
MGCLGMIVVILLAVVIYDQWRIEQLRREVAAIAAKVHAIQPNNSKDDKQSDLVTSLAEAEKYTRKAKQLIANKKPAEAQTFLDQALNKINSANTVSKDIIGDTAQYLGEAKDSAIEVFQKAWQDISEEPSQSKKSSTKTDEPKNSSKSDSGSKNTAK